MPENPVYEQYDKFIPVFGTQGSEWPQMRLFLSMIKENYAVTSGSAFRQTQYPEMVAENYTTPSSVAEATGAKTSGDKYAAVPFVCFLSEWLTSCANKVITNGEAAATPDTVTGAERIAALIEGVKTTWFKSFMMSILEAPTQATAIVTGLAGYKLHEEGGNFALEPVHGWCLLMPKDSYFRNDLEDWEEKINGVVIEK